VKSGLIAAIIPAPAPPKSSCLAQFGPALESVKKYDLIFLDPDNGLEVPSVERHHPRGSKYVFYDDLRAFASLKGMTIVVYQHICSNAATNFLR
jgi:hypothetical protein